MFSMCLLEDLSRNQPLQGALEVSNTSWVGHFLSKSCQHIVRGKGVSSTWALTCSRVNPESRMRGPVCEALWILDVTCGQMGTQGKARTCGRHLGYLELGFAGMEKCPSLCQAAGCSPWGQFGKNKEGASRNHCGGLM